MTKMFPKFGWLLILITRDITRPLFRPLLFAGRIFAGVGIGSISLVVPVSLFIVFCVGGSKGSTVL